MFTSNKGFHANSEGDSSSAGGGAKVIQLTDAERKKRQVSQAHKRKGPHQPPEFLSAKSKRPLFNLKRLGAHGEEGGASSVHPGSSEGAGGSGRAALGGGGYTALPGGGQGSSTVGGQATWKGRPGPTLGKGSAGRGGGKAGAAAGKGKQKAGTTTPMMKLAMVLNIVVLAFVMLLLLRTCGRQ